ncbi:hypothetical protein TOPH_07800, partial [Tolypocladium ophioglossoides CBS 100239]
SCQRHEDGKRRQAWLPIAGLVLAARWSWRCKRPLRNVPIRNSDRSRCHVSRRHRLRHSGVSSRTYPAQRKLAAAFLKPACYKSAASLFGSAVALFKIHQLNPRLADSAFL